MPLQESDLIFSNATNDLKSALTELKRSNLSITNRLRSIKSDADFVECVASAFDLPLVANERCGSWYIKPGLKGGSAYFKSTDGHHGQWSLSLRRLNLQVLGTIGKRGGYVLTSSRCAVSVKADVCISICRCIIVDSTRRGKSMPDALSKTVPIWTCVLNRLLFPNMPECHDLQTPESVVSDSEHAQIEERIPAFVNDLKALGTDLEAMRVQLRNKPLQPLWATPSTDLASTVLTLDEACHPIVLCTASSRDSENLHHISGYVQGAADDAEGWAFGLDAASFWRNQEALLAASENDLPDLIAQTVAESRAHSDARKPVLVKPTTNLFISNNAAITDMSDAFDIIVSCSEKPDDYLREQRKNRYVHLACATGKVGSRQLRNELPKLAQLASLLEPQAKILVTCQTGKDLSVGVALAIVCRHCQDDGFLRRTDDQQHQGLDKTITKQRLSWIMISMPDASPSRATLLSVNAYLFG